VKVLTEIQIKLKCFTAKLFTFIGIIFCGFHERGNLLGTWTVCCCCMVHYTHTLY